MSAAVIAKGVKVIVAAARRAHERGDTAERDRLMDDAEAQLGLMIAAMPQAKRA